MLPPRWLVCLSVVIGIASFWSYSSRPFRNHLQSTSMLQGVPMQVLAAFQAWKTEYNKVFSSPSEEKHRLSVFWQNYVKIQIEPSLPSTLKLNIFADLSEQEFRARYMSTFANTRNRTKRESSEFKVSNATPIKSGIDWRTQGAVTPVKNQMDCTSGWAFAATSAFESAAKIAGYPLVALSEQQLVDCSSSFGNSGCHGGWIDYSFEYIMSFGGLDSDAQYPYKGYEQRCKSSTAQLQPPKIVDYQDLPANDCSTLFTTIAQQPVPTRIAANAIQFYSTGVFSNKYCGTELNHAVLIVGYGTDSHSKKNYWIAKNSWGPSWGEHGYIYLDRDIMPSTGICGICMDSLIPIVKKPSA